MELKKGGNGGYHIGRWEGGEEIGEGFQREVTKSFQPLIPFHRSARVLAPFPCSAPLVQAKIYFCIFKARWEGGSVETAESSVAPGLDTKVL
jgi:hypothetical protein